MKSYESISIDKNSEEPMYLQVYSGIKNLIENGALKGDEKLPPIRNLSKKLEVNNVTIVNAYKMLEQKGFVYSRVGSGTYVKSVKSHIESKNNLDAETIEQGYIKMSGGEINFSTSTPNPNLFPVKEFKEVLNEVLDRDGGYAFGYQESQGFYPLRESVKNYLEENGITVSVRDVHVVSGAQQGIDIVSKALIGFNDSIVVESPTYTGALAAFKSRGARIIEVPLNNDGIDIHELEYVLKVENPKLIYVMTNFQNPTGISYSDEKKLKLLHLAEKYNCYILEDDYLSELRFYGDQRMPIKAMDSGNKVIYLKSFSKMFMPGIRLAFLVTPDIISKKILSAKHTTDISTAGLMQRAFDLYLRSSRWKNHIETMGDIYKKRYDEMINCLRMKTPFISFSEPDGGIHIWAETNMDSAVFGSIAKQMGVLIGPGSVFYVDGRKSNFFRVSFAGVEFEDISRGIDILKAAYENLSTIKEDNFFPFV